MTIIDRVRAQEIFDSRGNPTVEVDGPQKRRARAGRRSLGSVYRHARSCRTAGRR